MKKKLHMYSAILEAKKCLASNDVPVGAVIVYSGNIIARGRNSMTLLSNPILHAEIVAINNALSKKHHALLRKSIMYTTLEPCCMCSSALSHVRIGGIVFGAYSSKTGCVANGNQYFNNRSCLWKPYLIQGGILSSECRDLIQSFFRTVR